MMALEFAQPSAPTMATMSEKTKVRKAVQATAKLSVGARARTKVL